MANRLITITNANTLNIPKSAVVTERSQHAEGFLVVIDRINDLWLHGRGKDKPFVGRSISGGNISLRSDGDNSIVRILKRMDTNVLEFPVDGRTLRTDMTIVSDGNPKQSESAIVSTWLSWNQVSPILKMELGNCCRESAGGRIGGTLGRIGGFFIGAGTS